MKRFFLGVLNLVPWSVCRVIDHPLSSRASILAFYPGFLLMLSSGAFKLRSTPIRRAPLERISKNRARLR